MIKCYFRIGKCDGCPYVVWCEAYKKKYNCEPYEDEDLHPERFSSEELIIDEN
jgi:hypothetical protein